MNARKIIQPRGKSVARPICTLVLLIGFFALMNGCNNNNGKKKPNGPVPLVEAVQAHHGKLPLTQRLSGRVEAQNQIAVYPEVSAPIVEVRVKNSDTVKAGDVLVKLRDKEFRERFNQAVAGHGIAAAQLKQARAQFAEADAEYNRMKSLMEQGMTSPSELETAETRAVSAEANVSLAEARLAQAAASVAERQETLAQTTVRAPIPGSVGNRNAEIGMLVTGSTRLFTLGQLDAVRVEVSLTDRMLTYVQQGQRCQVSAPHTLADPVEGTISRISPFLNPVTHSTVAEIDLPNPDGRLVPGMFVSVDIFYGESDEATIVPMSALYEHPATGVTGVYASNESLNIRETAKTADDTTDDRSDPVQFRFIPVEVVARGRMEAGVRGLEPDLWVMTLGQNLLAGEDGKARVKRVSWDWVHKLQKLQREDLMEEVIREKKQQPEPTGTE